MASGFKMASSLRDLPVFCNHPPLGRGSELTVVPEAPNGYDSCASSYGGAKRAPYRRITQAKTSETSVAPRPMPRFE